MCYTYIVICITVYKFKPVHNQTKNHTAFANVLLITIAFQLLSKATHGDDNESEFAEIRNSIEFHQFLNRVLVFINADFEFSGLNSVFIKCFKVNSKYHYLDKYARKFTLKSLYIYIC